AAEACLFRGAATGVGERRRHLLGRKASLLIERALFTLGVLCGDSVGRADQGLIVAFTEVHLAHGGLVAHALERIADRRLVDLAGLLDGGLVGIDRGIGILGVIARRRSMTLAVRFDEGLVHLVVVGIVPIARADGDAGGHLLAEGTEHFGGGAERHQDLEILIEKAEVIGLA